MPTFLLRSGLLALCVVAGVPLSMDRTLYAVLVFQIAYILIIICRRPYKSTLHMFGLLLCEFTALSALLLPLLRLFYKTKEEIEVFIIFILEGLIILSIFLSLLRVTLTYIAVYK